MADRAEGQPIGSPDSTLETAMSLARAGWPVFPVKLVPHTKADGSTAVDKRPLVKWLEGATTDLEQIATWWGSQFPGAWIGVHAQRAGLVVVDLDVDKGEGAGRDNLKAAGIELPKTLHYKTRSGGSHHLYTAPKGRTLTIAKAHPVPGVDIRAGNGLMVYYGRPLNTAPTMAPAPDWACVDAGAKGGDRAAGASITQWLERAAPGKPSASVKAARDAVTNDLGHDAMLSAVSDLIKLGDERGAGKAFKQARAVYIEGRPDRARDWDNAAEGSVRRHGLPPVTLDLPEPTTREARRTDKATRRKALKAARGTFRRWLGDEYDLDVLLIVLAAAAVEQLDGDPLWLLIVGGPGGAKTETGMALQGAGARVVSSIASVGSLLSATSRGERTKEATGGLLREMGDHGLLFIKDFTTIISQNANTRAEVLAALREIFDGYWTREVGTDGGRSLNWQGRLGLIGAVTTAWDTAHGVVAAMGDRFALVRIDSRHGRLSAGRQALANVGSETVMRGELAEATGRVLASVDTSRPPSLEQRDEEAILAAAEVVTRARTAVEHDYQRKVVDAHAPESPTRFAKQLGQVMRGALAVGVKRKQALALAIRCARDSMPPLRLAVLQDVAAHPFTSTSSAVKRLQKPRSTIDRTLQELHLLELLVVDSAPEGSTAWHYSVAPGVDLDALSTDPPDPFIAITHKLGESNHEYSHR